MLTLILLCLIVSRFSKSINGLYLHGKCECGSSLTMVLLCFNCPSKLIAYLFTYWKSKAVTDYFLLMILFFYFREWFEQFLSISSNKSNALIFYTHYKNHWIPLLFLNLGFYCNCASLGVLHCIWEQIQ